MRKRESYLNIKLESTLCNHYSISNTTDCVEIYGQHGSGKSLILIDSIAQLVLMDSPKHILYISYKPLRKGLLAERMIHYLSEAKCQQYIDDKLKKLLSIRVSNFAELVVALCKSEQVADVQCIMIDSIDMFVSDDGANMVYYLLNKMKLRRRVGIVYTSNIYYSNSITSRMWSISKYIADIVIEAGIKPTMIANSMLSIRKIE